MTRLLTWNIRHGGGARTEAIADAIASHNPDIVVLSEFRNNQFGAHLLECFADMGLVHQRSGRAAPPANTVSIAARFALTPLPGAGRLGAWSHRVVAVRCGDIRLAGLYLPNLKAKLSLLEYLVSLPLAYLKEPTLLVGDLNSGKQGIDGPDTFVFFEGTFLEKLESQGWTDGFRHFHGLAQEFTWYSHRHNGYRLDYTFSSPPMTDRLDAAWHSHAEREAGLSDHSILMVDFD
jgi:exodeoxyribonuclease-3